jgi:hypothetical protein
MKRKRIRREEPPATIPDAPRPVPDVEIPKMDPDLWGTEGGGGAYPGGPTGKKKPKRRD